MSCTITVVIGRHHTIICHGHPFINILIMHLVPNTTRCHLSMSFVIPNSQNHKVKTKPQYATQETLYPEYKVTLVAQMNGPTWHTWIS